MPVPQILTSSEARSALPGIGEEIARLGLDFTPVIFGSHRKPVGAIIPAALLDQMENLLEDIVISQQVTSRLAEGEGSKTVADLAAELGLDSADFE